MNEQKTVKVDTNPFASNQPDIGSSPRSGDYGGSNWDKTQYMPSESPTPRPGESQWPPQPPLSQEPSTWGKETTPSGGAPTMLIGAPKPEPAFAWLVIVSGPVNVQQIGIPLPVKNTGVTTIGRVPGNSIVISDPTCSSQHAKIRLETDPEGHQAFVIYDLASSNGLYIGTKDNYRDESSRVYRHVLRDGDYLLIGETTLVFKQI